MKPLRRLIVPAVAAATTDIDAAVAAAIREAYSFEGVDLATRRSSRKKSKAALARFLFTYPDLVRALASRYEQVSTGTFSDARYVHLWIYYHLEELSASR